MTMTQLYLIEHSTPLKVAVFLLLILYLVVRLSRMDSVKDLLVRDIFVIAVFFIFLAVFPSTHALSKLHVYPALLKADKVYLRTLPSVFFIETGLDRNVLLGEKKQ